MANYFLESSPSNSPQYLAERNFFEPLSTILKPRIMPLGLKDIDAIFHADDPEGHRRKLVLNIRRANSKILNRCSEVAIILDGRNGWLGDLIEASRAIPVLATSGKKVLVFTSHADLMEGMDSENVSIISIPSHISPASDFLDIDELVGFIGNYHTDILLSPMQAAWPVIMEIEHSDGRTRIKDKASIATKINAAFPCANSDFTAIERGVKDVWQATPMHQLQALQALLFLWGLDSVLEWNEFPAAFIKPSIATRRNAAASFAATYRSGSLPIIVHPGTSLSKPMKLGKRFPIASWEATLRCISESFTDTEKTMAHFMFYADVEQQGVAERLQSIAVALNLSAEVLKLHTTNSLGEFAHILKIASEHKGLIIGNDSMAAAHMGPAVGLRSLVLGNRIFLPTFYAPVDDSLLALPPDGVAETATIPVGEVVKALRMSMGR